MYPEDLYFFLVISKFSSTCTFLKSDIIKKLTSSLKETDVICFQSYLQYIGPVGWFRTCCRVIAPNIARYPSIMFSTLFRKGSYVVGRCWMSSHEFRFLGRFSITITFPIVVPVRCWSL